MMKLVDLVFVAFLVSQSRAQINPENGLTPAEEKIFLDRHNEFRREAAKKYKAQNMNELVWDTYLSKMAFDWAKNCEFYHGVTSEYTGDYGQNLYMTTSETNKYGSVNIWYNEYKFYDFETGDCNPGPCGHFTQLIWASSKKLGCAHYLCPKLYNPGTGVTHKDANHIVCQYDPPGNFQGRPPLAVGPLCSKCPNGKGFCNDGLCTDKCPAGAKCECKIKCNACAQIDQSTCSCLCQPGFTGTFCEDICSDKDERCGKSYPAFLCTHETYKKTMLLKCPATCGFCSRPSESWSCDTLTYKEQFTPGRYVGYMSKHGRNGECVFPFTYENKTYDRCTEMDSVYPEPWCATKEVLVSLQTDWGHCVPVVTYQGANPGQPCQFPYKYLDQLHYKCLGDDAGFYWCGLTENYDQDRQFGYCNMTLIPEKAETAKA